MGLPVEKRSEFAIAFVHKMRSSFAEGEIFVTKLDGHCTARTLSEFARRALGWTLEKFCDEVAATANRNPIIYSPNKVYIF